MDEKRQKQDELLKEEKDRMRRCCRKRRAVLRAGLAAGGCVLAAAVFAALCLYSIPGIRAGMQTFKAKKMIKDENYEQAVSCYKKALEIRSNSPKTYTAMAKLYLDLDDYKSAGDILEEGLAATGNPDVKDSYLTFLLNESTRDFNEENCSWKTVEDLVKVIREDPESEKANKLLNIFYERFVSTSDGTDRTHSFLNPENCEKYIQLMENLLAIYQEHPGEELRQQIHQYAFLNSGTVNLPVNQLQTYAELLQKVMEITDTGDEMNWIPALLKAEEVHEYFSPVLRAFEEGNFELMKELIVSDEYLAIRDAFIDNQMEYWENTTYQPVSDIGVSFHLKNGRRTFRFMDEDPKEAKKGFIKVWGFRWVDNGHLRTGISYVPVQDREDEDLYREYEIMRWWSTARNIASTESTYAKMNYRFETRHYREDGLVTDVINDWGGPYEYRDCYE